VGYCVDVVELGAHLDYAVHACEMEFICRLG
jgi:hypothetical protein